MANTYYTVLTDTGVQKQVAAQAGGAKIEITHFAVGDGGGVAVVPNKAQLALVNEKWRGPINVISVDAVNTNWVVIEGIVPSDAGDFVIREVGFFDAEGDLVAVGNYPQTFKPTTISGVIADIAIKAIIQVSNSDVLKIEVDPNVTVASRDYVDKTIAAHSDKKASPTTLGHIMVGDGLGVTNEGKLSVMVDGVPKGIISMWSGALTSIPGGWALCDGLNGTPNLTDRFIVGAGGKYAVNDIGGAETVTLTEGQLPSHSHSSGTLSATSNGSHSHTVSGTTSTDGAHNHTYNSNGGTGSTSAQQGGNSVSTTSTNGEHSHTVSGSTNSTGAHTHSISGSTASTGSGQAHENRPPYFALAFIMKL